MTLSINLLVRYQTFFILNSSDHEYYFMVKLFKMVSSHSNLQRIFIFAHLTTRRPGTSVCWRTKEYQLQLHIHLDSCSNWNMHEFCSLYRICHGQSSLHDTPSTQAVAPSYCITKQTSIYGLSYQEAGIHL